MCVCVCVCVCVCLVVVLWLLFCSMVIFFIPVVDYNIQNTNSIDIMKHFPRVSVRYYTLTAHTGKQIKRTISAHREVRVDKSSFVYVPLRRIQFKTIYARFSAFRAITLIKKISRKVVTASFYSRCLNGSLTYE